MKKILLPLLLSTLACAAQAATITVTDVTDGSVSGKCTLRGAVESVNNNSAMAGCTSSGSGAIDTIEFDSSLAGATIGVQSAAGGEIKITKNLFINATAGGITLDANPGQSTPGGNRIFQVTGGGSLSITGVTFRNGKAGRDGNYGGAIYVNLFDSHSLTLEGCAFEGNLADDNGGAVYASTAAINNSSFTNNEADYGGAVHASTTVAISNSAFTSNKAISNGGAVFTWGTAAISNSTFSGNETSGGGGAVYSTTTTISNSSFTSNKAGNGGAVHSTTTTISNSAFTSNEARGGGGAVYANETATIRNSTFSSNEADNHGGAVSANTAAIISNSTFSSNQAISSDGGAVWTNIAAISNSIFNNNRADIEGGAVFAYDSLDARHLTLLNNSATGTGQALYVYDFSGTAALHNSIIIGSNNADQCASQNGTAFNGGSYNLEGWVNTQGVWQVAATSCGSSITTMPTAGSALNAIINPTLADNGGPTKTLALTAGSPAIGAADPVTGGTSEMLDSTGAWTDATLDQRGSARKANAASGRDVGAYESNGLTITGNMPNGTEGVVYAGGSVIASGGTGTITYAVTSGVLPPELSLQPDGTVTGTPTQAGTWSFAITARDASGNLTGMGFEVTIHPFSTGTGNTPIPALPAPLLLMLAALVGAAAATRQRRR